MRNRYPGICYFCGGNVPAGEGHFERSAGSWRTIHAFCVDRQRVLKRQQRERLAGEVQ